MRKNVASQVVAFQMVNATDGSAVTTGTPTVYYTIDGGTQGTGAGTATHEGNGQWSYAPAQAETNGNHVAFTMVLTDAISQCVNVYPVAYDETDATLGITFPTNFSDLAITASTGLVSVGTNNDKTGYTIAGTLTTLDSLDSQQDVQHLATQAAVAVLNDFNPAVDQVIVATNNDKTGYSLTQAFPSNFADLAITATTGQVDVNDFSSTAETAIAAQVGVGLAVYDPPTKTELDSGFSSQLSSIQSEFTTIKGGTWSAGTDTLEAIRDASGGGGASNPQVLQSTTIATLASQTSFTLTAGSADNDAYNNCMAVVTDSATSTQKAVGYVSDYVGATKTVTLKSDPGVFTMAAGDTIDIIAVGADLPSINARFDTVDLGFVNVGLDTDSIKARIGTPASDLATELAAVLADTGTDGVVISTATAQAIADEILSRSVSNVEATTSEHTLATIVLAILESARSSTTWTIKRTDGSTTHATKTLTLDTTASPVVGVE